MPAGPKRKIDVDRLPAFAIRIRDVRGEQSRAKFAETLGVSAMAVSHWENGTYEPTAAIYSKLAALAKGDESTWLFREAKYRSGLTEDAIGSIRDMQTMADPPVPGGDRRTKTRRRSPFVEVRLLEVMAGAGPGYILEGESKEGSLLIPKDICPNPKETACVRVRGESMEPTIINGTITAVDGSQKRAEKLIGKIVAAWHESEGVVVKRLVRAEGKLRLASDNPGYYPRDLDEGWQLVGRVIWWIQQA